MPEIEIIPAPFAIQDEPYPPMLLCEGSAGFYHTDSHNQNTVLPLPRLFFFEMYFPPFISRTNLQMLSGIGYTAASYPAAGIPPVLKSFWLNYFLTGAKKSLFYEWYVRGSYSADDLLPPEKNGSGVMTFALAGVKGRSASAAAGAIYSYSPLGGHFAVPALRVALSTSKIFMEMVFPQKLEVRFLPLSKLSLSGYVRYDPASWLISAENQVLSSTRWQFGIDADTKIVFWLWLRAGAGYETMNHLSMADNTYGSIPGQVKIKIGLLMRP